ncbi:aminotransferase class I/II-fold pyridoxal phosphate-dependent enzyme [Streptococcus dentasini]
MKGKIMNERYLNILDEVHDWKSKGYYPFFPKIKEYDHTVVFDNGMKSIAFGSCDYFGLATNQVLKNAAKQAIDDYGTNTYGSQVICGYTDLHRTLETKILSYLGYADNDRESILFPSGLHANVGCISTLLDEKDIVFSDKYAHTSIYLGIQLSGAKNVVFKHNNMKHLEKKISEKDCQGKKYIMVDGLYSADGDEAPMDEIVKIAKKYQASILVDEAHSFGIMGENGRGVSEIYDAMEDIDCYIGTMSKGVGSVGGFAVLRKTDAEKVRHFAPTYTSSRANPPATIAASIAGIDYIKEYGDQLRERLKKNVLFLVEELNKIGVNIQVSSHVVPIIIGDNDTTMQVADYLLKGGIHTGVFVSPAVPRGASRLRIGVTVFQTLDDCRLLIELLKQAKKLYNF